jgi:hypothetical protein
VTSPDSAPICFSTGVPSTSSHLSPPGIASRSSGLIRTMVGRMFIVVPLRVPAS